MFKSADDRVKEEIKLNMKKEFEKHKAVMNLYSVFENKTFSKDIQFYKQFGDELVYEISGNSESKHDKNLEIDVIDEDENGEFSDYTSQNNQNKEHKYCDKSIPINLNKQEYSIYSTIENMFKSTINKKNKIVLDHQTIVDMTEDIAN